MFRRAPKIRRLKRRHKVDQLIAAMRYEDKLVDVSGQVIDLGVPVRCEAVVAASELNDPRAVDAIGTVALDDEDYRVRRAAASALVELLQDFDERNARYRDGANDTDEPKTETDSSEAAWQAIGPAQVARLFLLAGDDEMIEAHETLLVRVLGGDASADIADVMLEELLQTLADPRPDVVERAVRLIVLRAPERVDGLIVALRDPARAAAVATTLGKLRDNRALGPLVAALRSEDPAVRRECVSALGEMADSRVVAALFSATSDHDYYVREEALAALDKLGSIGVIGGVAKALSTVGTELTGGRWPTRELPGHYAAALEVGSGTEPAESKTARRDARVRDSEIRDADQVLAPRDATAVAQAGDGTTDHASDAELADVPSGEPMAIPASDGTMLHAEVFGPAGAPTIVLAHGWGVALRLWTHQIRDLSEDFRVVAYDLRGHGRSESAQSGDYSLDRFGDDLEAVLAACVEQGARATLVGHSLGAASITAWARRYHVERRVHAAALLHPGFGDVVAEHLLVRLTPPSMPENSHSGSASARTLRVHDAVVRYVVFGPAASPPQVAFYERMLFECPTNVRAQCSITIAQTQLGDALSHLTVPTLVVAGELDRLTPPGHARTIAGMLPDLAALAELPETGHMGPLEQPPQVTQLLRELISDASRSARA